MRLLRKSYAIIKTLEVYYIEVLPFAIFYMVVPVFKGQSPKMRQADKGGWEYSYRKGCK